MFRQNHCRRHHRSRRHRRGILTTTLKNKGFEIYRLTCL